MTVLTYRSHQPCARKRNVKILLVRPFKASLHFVKESFLVLKYKTERVNFALNNVFICIQKAQT